MKGFSVIEENSENIKADSLKKGDIVIATNPNYTLLLIHYNYAQNGGYHWIGVRSGGQHINGPYQTISEAVKDAQKYQFKVHHVSI